MDNNLHDVTQVRRHIHTAADAAAAVMPQPQLEKQPQQEPWLQLQHTPYGNQEYPSVSICVRTRLANRMCALCSVTFQPHFEVVPAYLPPPRHVFVLRLMCLAVRCRPSWRMCCSALSVPRALMRHTLTATGWLHSSTSPASPCASSSVGQHGPVRTSCCHSCPVQQTSGSLHKQGLAWHAHQRLQLLCTWVGGCCQ